MSSKDPEARVAPSGEKAILYIRLVCPSSVSRGAPSATRHRRISPSEKPEARVALSGEKATLDTQLPVSMKRKRARVCES